MPDAREVNRRPRRTGGHGLAGPAAVPCPADTSADTSAAERGACLTVVSGVIERIEVKRRKEYSWLYFTDGRPQRRLGVSRDDARSFEPGDHLEPTYWRGKVWQAAGEHHVWREHAPAPGEVAVIAAGLALAAGSLATLGLLALAWRATRAGEPGGRAQTPPGCATRSSSSAPTASSSAEPSAW